MPVNIAQKPKNRKMMELIVYIASESSTDEKFGLVKLNKLILEADMEAFRRTGKTITGSKYSKQEFGPCAKLFLPAKEELVRQERLAILARKHYNREQKWPVALGEPDMDVFTPREVALLGSILRRYWDKNATEMSTYSHRSLAWQAAEIGDELSYSALLFHAGPIAAPDIAAAKELSELAASCLGS